MCVEPSKQKANKTSTVIRRAFHSCRAASNSVIVGFFRDSDADRVERDITMARRVLANKMENEQQEKR